LGEGPTHIFASGFIFFRSLKLSRSLKLVRNLALGLEFFLNENKVGNGALKSSFEKGGFGGIYSSYKISAIPS
jgi:hypothetical protein